MKVDSGPASVLVASGEGRYSDPWHPFAHTSAEIAAVLAGHDFAVSIEYDVDLALSRLDGVDLLIVNAGDPWRSRGSTARIPAESRHGLESAFERGIGILAFHASVASLRDYPAWAAAVGGIWLPGVSYHPPGGNTRVLGRNFPDGADVADFEVSDERYCRIQAVGSRHVVAEHESNGGLEPTVWTRQYGRSRVAVDLLGHDLRSFESRGHRDLIVRLAQWASSPPSQRRAPHIGNLDGGVHDTSHHD